MLSCNAWPASAALAPPVTVAALQAWLADQGDGAVERLGPSAQPLGVAVWYRSHIQIAELRRAHGVDWLVLQTTFCAQPRLRATVLPLLAQANMTMEAGRWFRLPRPSRLVCSYEVPAHGLQRAPFMALWERFRAEAVSHGIDLELRSRATNWLLWLERTGRKPPRRPGRRKRQQEVP